MNRQFIHSLWIVLATIIALTLLHACENSISMQDSPPQG
jgi:hypothetical protein